MITDTFYMALKISGIGMAGIFMFMLFFWAIIVLLHKMFPVKPAKTETTEE